MWACLEQHLTGGVEADAARVEGDHPYSWNGVGGAESELDIRLAWNLAAVRTDAQL
jgi:hypothetical protein